MVANSRVREPGVQGLGSQGVRFGSGLRLVA